MGKPSNKMKQAAYRHSDAGKLARKMYLMQPEVKLRMSLRRAAKKKMKGGY